MAISNTSNDPAITDINVTPLVDVSLVLVIIFMAVAPFVMQAGITASQSRAGAVKGKASMAHNVSIELSATGAIKVNNKAVTKENLETALRQEIAKSKDHLVYISADPKIQVKEIVYILDTAKQMGAFIKFAMA